MSGVAVLPVRLHRVALGLSGLSSRLWRIVVRVPVPLLLALLVLLCLGQHARARTALFAGLATLGFALALGFFLQALLMRVLWQGLLVPRPPPVAAVDYEAAWSAALEYLRARRPASEVGWLAELEPFDARHGYPWPRGGALRGGGAAPWPQLVVGLRLSTTSAHEWLSAVEARGRLLDEALSAVLGRTTLAAFVWAEEVEPGPHR